MVLFSALPLDGQWNDNRRDTRARDDPPVLAVISDGEAALVRQRPRSPSPRSDSTAPRGLGTYHALCVIIDV
jgi:hypothetical protein